LDNTEVNLSGCDGLLDDSDEPFVYTLEPIKTAL
jgi:hypothetical protein